MRIKKVVLFCFVVAALYACSHLKYEEDIGLISSGYANSPELYVLVDAKPCKGGCYIVKPTSITKVTIPIRPYEYRLDFQTSANVGFSRLIDVPAGESVDLVFDTIEPVFNMIGRIYPKDNRDPTVSMFFEARVRQVLPEYYPKVTPYLANGWLVFGSDSLYTCHMNKCFGEKTTSVKDRHIGTGPIWTESFMGRISYYDNL